MPSYRCKGQWLNTVKPKDGGRPLVTLHQPGDVVEYDGLPSDNLEPLDRAAKKRAEEAKEVFKKQDNDAALRKADGGMAILAALTAALQQAQVAAPQHTPAITLSPGPAIHPGSGPISHARTDPPKHGR